MARVIQWVLVLVTCLSVLAQHEYSYHSHRGAALESTPSCNMAAENPIRVHRGSPFLIGSFPPRARSMEYYNEGLGYYGHNHKQLLPHPHPQDCTWVFEAAGNCSLEFHSHSFQRGDVDCREQYFLIGDETVEQRFCGFRSPKHFLSRSRQLFLTHYKRNGYRSAGVAYVNGEIRCIKRTPPPIVCPETACIHPNPFNTSDGIFAVGTIDVPGRLSPARVLDRCQNTGGCTNINVVCELPIAPVNDTHTQCNRTLIFPADPPEHKCSSDFVECPVPGPCTGRVSQATANPVDEQNFTCTATVPQTCLFGIRMCSANLT